MGWMKRRKQPHEARAALPEKLKTAEQRQAAPAAAPKASKPKKGAKQ